MKRWRVEGYVNSGIASHFQEYDGGNRPPVAAEAHMYALLDKSKANCDFAEIVDIDCLITVDKGLETQYQRFKTVRAVER